MGPSGFTSHLKEGVLRVFIALKITSLWPGSNPRPLGPVASTLTTIPPRRRVCIRAYIYIYIYTHTHTHTHTHRVIHKSLRDFRTLQCNNQDRHIRKEHINGQRNSTSVQCVIMAYLRVLPLEGSCVEKWLPSTMGCCSVCGRNWITGLTSAASPGVYIWSTCKVGHTLGEFLCLLICSFLLCLSWLLYCRVRKSRRDL
jgi:hypothetical protein